ncbi:hypothetical protein EDB80DRAFT_870237 [Ilyonectria destructans]|nr:hypothetical protein EDB80DRAFT_870237 [Ilyonectria destructans]
MRLHEYLQIFCFEWLKAGSIRDSGMDPSFEYSGLVCLNLLGWTFASSTRGSGQPNFDVRETGEAYELYGELPGMNKEEVHIEFTEPQTMVIRGKTEQTCTSGTPPAGLVRVTTIDSTITEGSKEHQTSH